MSNFPPYGHSNNKLEVELDLFTYATKSRTRLEHATGVDTSQFNKNDDDLANLKTEVDKLEKLDIDKLTAVSVDLKNVSAVVDKKVVEKDVYDKLIKNFDAIDTSKLVKKRI